MNTTLSLQELNLAAAGDKNEIKMSILPQFLLLEAKFM